MENTLTFTDGPTKCRHLRSKEIYFNLGFHPSGMESQGTPCWCFKTQQIFGPDGSVADRTGCNDERSCYEKDVI